MTSLLVSDLDGTLLNSAKAVSERTVSVLNRFVADGGMFSVATARMAYGCDQLVADLDLRLPGVVMNGAAIYSFAEGKYLEVQSMSAVATDQVAAAVAEAGAGAFVYAVEGDRIRLGCSREADLAYEQYNSTRARATVGELVVLGLENWDQLGEMVYLAVVGSQAQLVAVQKSLADVPDLVAHPYHNVYTGTECLEYSSGAGGKEAAVLRLKELVGADQLIVFGDNHNDLGMMRLADRSFAPAGSAPEALRIADEIVPSNDEDGVAEAVLRYGQGWLATQPS